MAGAVRGGREGGKRGRGEGGEAALGHKVRGDAGSSVSSCVPLSGPRHVPIRAQVTGAASSTTSSSADEEFDPQLSLRSKVTTLGKPKGALAGEGRLFTLQTSGPMWAPAATGSLEESHFLASDSTRLFLPGVPQESSLFSVVNFYRLAFLRDVKLGRGKKTDVFP